MHLMRPSLFFLTVCAALASQACDRRTEAFIPREAEPPAPTTPVTIPTLQEQRGEERLQMGARGSTQGGAPMAPFAGGAGGADAPAAEDPTKVIRGTLRLAEGVTPPDQGVLFVIARLPNMRPPLAAVRLPIDRFPLEFRIGPADRAPMMGSNVQFDGPIQLSARIDLDGNPMTRSAGELVGDAGEIQAGTSGVQIVLKPGGQ
jgi:hypothetical protein